MTKSGYKSDFKGVKITLTSNQRWVFSSHKKPEQELIVWTNRDGEIFSQLKSAFKEEKK